jgi:hypothetical protein
MNGNNVGVGDNDKGEFKKRTEVRQQFIFGLNKLFLHNEMDGMSIIGNTAFTVISSTSLFPAAFHPFYSQNFHIPLSL